MIMEIRVHLGSIFLNLVERISCLIPFPFSFFLLYFKRLFGGVVHGKDIRAEIFLERKQRMNLVVPSFPSFGSKLITTSHRLPSFMLPFIFFSIIF